MSIYGEGEYDVPRRTARRAAAASGGAAPRPSVGVRLPALRRELHPVPTSETKPLIPTSVYAITKRDHEELALVIGAAYGIPTVALRFFNVYGPGQALSNPYTGVAAIFASRLLNGQPPIVFEDGQQSRDFIHVSATSFAGIVLALESEARSGRRVNLGTGRPRPSSDVARMLAERARTSSSSGEIVDQYRAGDIRHCYADVAERRGAARLPG